MTIIHPYRVRNPFIGNCLVSILSFLCFLCFFLFLELGRNWSVSLCSVLCISCLLIVQPYQDGLYAFDWSFFPTYPYCFWNTYVITQLFCCWLFNKCFFVLQEKWRSDCRMSFLYSMIFFFFLNALTCLSFIFHSCSVTVSPWN